VLKKWQQADLQMVEKWEKESSGSGKDVKVMGGRDKWKA